MSMKVCVIGLGRFGYNVATTLAQKNVEVIAVDKEESLVASIRDSVTQALCMDIYNQYDLQSIGVEDVDLVIVCMGKNFDQTILMTALLKKRLHVKRVISRAINSIHQEILTLIGADETVIPEKSVGIALAERISSQFQQYIKITKNFHIIECQTPKDFIHQSIESIDFYTTYHVTLVGIKKDDEALSVPQDYIIEPDDILILAGTEANLKKIVKK